jgi:hypothetical protein
MPLPTIAFGILLSTFYGGIYHAVRGGSTRKIAFYLGLSWAGFWLGVLLGWYLGWSFAKVGLLNAGMGTLFSLVFMLIGDLLSYIFAVLKETEQPRR